MRNHAKGCAGQIGPWGVAQMQDVCNPDEAIGHTSLHADRARSRGGCHEAGSSEVRDEGWPVRRAREALWEVGLSRGEIVWVAV